MSEKAKPEKGKKPVTIIVNAQQKTVAKEQLFFDDVVDLAYPGGPRGATLVYTVAYRRARGNKSGTLVEGESVPVKEGMIFDVTQTDKS